MDRGVGGDGPAAPSRLLVAAPGTGCLVSAEESSPASITYDGDGAATGGVVAWTGGSGGGKVRARGKRSWPAWWVRTGAGAGSMPSSGPLAGGTDLGWRALATPIASPVSSLRSGVSDAPALHEVEQALRPAVTALLQTWITHNDTYFESNTPQEMTVFHAMKKPAISIEDYIERIFTYALCSKSCFLIAAFYMERVAVKNAALRATSLNSHRLLITSVMLAAKFFDDIFYNNAYYAKVGGVPVSELNALELAMLKELDYGLNMSAEEFALYESEVSRSAVAHQPALAAAFMELGVAMEPLSPSPVRTPRPALSSAPPSSPSCWQPAGRILQLRYLRGNGDVPFVEEEAWTVSEVTPGVSRASTPYFGPL